VEFDVFIVHARYVHIMVLGLFWVEMYLFEDLRDAHRRTVESDLVVSVGQMRNISLFVREDVYGDVVGVVSGSGDVVVTHNRLCRCRPLCFSVNLLETKLTFF